MSSVNRINVQSAKTESKADLVSMEASGESNGQRSNGRLQNQLTFSASAWARRTRLEKLLFVTIAVLLVALVVVVALAVNRILRTEDTYRSSSRVCNSPTCISSADTLIKNMDLTVDPCDDFYQYACGGFDKRVRIPDDRSSRSQFAIIDDELDEQLREILESNATEGGSLVFHQARDHYASCMDLDRLDRIGLKPLQDLLKTFGGWPVLENNWDENSFKWDEMVYKFRRNGYSTDYLFDFSIATDIRNSTLRTIYFDQASLGMSREYLIKGIDDEDVTHYYNYMQKVAVLLGADPVRAASELRESLLFEIKLANASLPREQRRNASKLYNPMKLSEMSGIADIVDWTTYVNNVLTEDLLQVDSNERVVVSTPGYLKNFTTILASEPKRNIANYMLWRAARASIGFLNKDAREIIEEYSRNVTGKKATTPRWKSCVGSASGSFSAAVGKMYVLKHFKENAKASVLEMVTDIKEEFRNILDEIDWMDEETRERAHLKLNAIKDYIGYPEEILVNSNLEELYAGLQISPTNYFQNGINMSIWSTNYHWKKLREKVDKTDWKRHAYPAVVNAFYSSIENSIQFPAGILQGIFYQNDRPNYLNYGGIGWVIGHEITHGFDDQGRQYDNVGNLKDWWDLETKNRFIGKTRCIIEQYGNYTASSVNLQLNGINTQGENIADNGGLKEAYRGYKRWIRRNGNERSLPGLDLKPIQLFWVGAANTWCSKYRPKSLEMRIRTGAHSPGMFRVKGPFSNSQEFSKDFNCPLGSPMNPVKKCEVW